MGKPHKGRFTPKNPEKYIASNLNNIITRSTWESTFCTLLDAHPNILGWCSEAIRIPYVHPFTGKHTIYVPDFFVVYKDKDGVEHREIVEVKPQDEVPGHKGKVSKLKEARQVVNAAKWQAAMKFCQARGWHFRIATEKELFAFNRNK